MVAFNGDLTIEFLQDLLGEVDTDSNEIITFEECLKVFIVLKMVELIEALLYWKEHVQIVDVLVAEDGDRVLKNKLQASGTTIKFNLKFDGVFLEL